MKNDSPYRPDHSLLHAALLLLGGLGTIAAGLYLLMAIDESLLPRHQIRGAEVPMDRRIRELPRRSPTTQRSPMVGHRTHRVREPPALVGGGVPAWTGASRPSVSLKKSSSQPPQGSYDVNPDFNHAQLGAHSKPSGNGPTGDARPNADAGAPGGDGSISRAPGAKITSSAPDLDEREVGGTANGDVPGWRSESRTLARRGRALSNELGRIDREKSREATGSRRESVEGESPDEAKTATSTRTSTSSVPGTPTDPDQVPLGGAEWLAAAGAAYALNRLRERDATESDAEDDS